MTAPMCENCDHFRKYDEFDLVDDFQKRMSDGFCFDPNPVDNNMPRPKVDWCINFYNKEEELKKFDTPNKKYYKSITSFI
nr:MAG: hypothetical protein [uncultured archaeon]